VSIGVDSNGSVNERIFTFKSTEDVFRIGNWIIPFVFVHIEIVSTIFLIERAVESMTSTFTVSILEQPFVSIVVRVYIIVIFGYAKGFKQSVQDNPMEGLH
jgi:hypothetical protein